MPTTRRYTILPIEAYGRLVALWIKINIGVDVLGVALAIADLSLLRELPWSAPLDEFGAAPNASDLTIFTGLLRLPIMVVAVITAVLVLKWVYRANRNAHALASGLNSNPPWAVAWFFIPFAFLWKPFEPMEESWKVSRDAEGWRREATPAVLRWWFGLWLVGTVLGNLTMRLAFGASTVGQLRWLNATEAVIACANIGSAVCLLYIVRNVSAGLERQIEDRAARDVISG